MILSFEARKPNWLAIIAKVSLILIIALVFWQLQALIEAKTMAFCQTYQGKLYGRGPLYAKIASYPIWLIGLPLIMRQYKKLKRLIGRQTQIFSIDNEAKHIEHLSYDKKGKIIKAQLPYDRLLKAEAAIKQSKLGELFNKGTINLDLSLESQGLPLSCRFSLPGVKEPAIIQKEFGRIKIAPALNLEQLRQTAAQRIKRDSYNQAELKKAGQYGIPVEDLGYAGIG